jgi:hypothetical protein
MSANPYASPENVGYAPPVTANLTRIVYWFLAVGSVIALFIFLLLPNVRYAPEAARRMQCSNHLKQIGLALQNYHDGYGTLPPAYVADAEGKPMHSWRVLILPYMEHKGLYTRYNFNEPWNGPNNSRLHREVVHEFCCPSRSRQESTETSYVAVVDPQTAWPREKAIGFSSVTDGNSNTILVVEMAKSGIHWMEPRDLQMAEIPIAVNQKGSRGISSEHANVALALFADGHTAALTYNTPAEIIRRLLTIADGEQIGDY